MAPAVATLVVRHLVHMAGAQVVVALRAMGKLITACVPVVPERCMRREE
ncbi:hypothetical protein ACWGIV_09605 [Streptomyces sp. NPDC054844]